MSQANGWNLVQLIPVTPLKWKGAFLQRCSCAQGFSAKGLIKVN